MKFKTIMIIKAIACLTFFPVMIILPEQFLTFMGMTSFGVAGAFLARIYGATLVGNLMLSWFGRNAE